jgi:hypothetical protein
LPDLATGEYHIQSAAPGFQIATIRRRIETSYLNLTVRLQVKHVSEKIQVTSSIPELNIEQRV